MGRMSVIYPSLALRRSFWVLDLSVAVVCALFMGRVVASYIYPAPAVDSDTNNPSAEARQILFPHPAPVETEHLAKSGIFGAGSFKSQVVEPAPPPPPPPPPSDGVTESELNLELKGTVYDPNPSLRRAIIENKKLRTGDLVYSVGDEVSPEVVVSEIWWRRVILDERGKRTYLEWNPEEEEEQPTRVAAAPPRPATVPERAVVPRTIELSREDMLGRGEELLALRDSVNVIPYEEHGRVVGLQVNNLGDSAIAKEMGIEEGDVIQTINGVRLTDTAKAFEALEKFSNASMIRIGLTRGGRRTFVTYRLK